MPSWSFLESENINILVTSGHKSSADDNQNFMFASGSKPTGIAKKPAQCMLLQWACLNAMQKFKWEPVCALLKNDFQMSQKQKHKFKKDMPSGFQKIWAITKVHSFIAVACSADFVLKPVRKNGEWSAPQKCHFIARLLCCLGFNRSNFRILNVTAVWKQHCHLAKPVCWSRKHGNNVLGTSASMVLLFLLLPLVWDTRQNDENTI